MPRTMVAASTRTTVWGSFRRGIATGVWLAGITAAAPVFAQATPAAPAPKAAPAPATQSAPALATKAAPVVATQAPPAPATKAAPAPPAKATPAAANPEDRKSTRLN